MFIIQASDNDKKIPKTQVDYVSQFDRAIKLVNLAGAFSWSISPGLPVDQFGRGFQ